MATATATKARSKTATKKAAKKTVRKTTNKVVREAAAKTTKKSAPKKAVQKSKKLSVKGSNKTECIKIQDHTVDCTRAPEADIKTKTNSTRTASVKKVATKPAKKNTKAVKKAPKTEGEAKVTKSEARQTKNTQPKQTKEKKTKEKPTKNAKAIKGLSIKNLSKEMKALEDWELNKTETQIAKTFRFPNFVSALAFVAKVTVHAEVLDHHPDIELSYGKVKVKLTTHETGSLTKLDFALAERIDAIVVRV